MPERRAWRGLALGLACCLSFVPAPAAEAQDEGEAGGSGPRRSLVVGSKSFTEGRLLSELMAQLLEERTGEPVVRRYNLGGTLLVSRAPAEGEIDLYPEYTGTAWSAVLGRTDKAADPLRTYLEVARAYRERFRLEWLSPFGFSNSYALAVREEVAAERGLTRISDLAAHAGGLTAAFSHEFSNREDGYPGLARAYGLDLGEVRGMEHGLAYEAIRTGRADLTDAYTTDGKLRRFAVRVLEDDRGFFPPYDCAPVVRSEVLEERPEVREILGELAFTLPAERMQGLNFEVEEEGRSFAEVARAFLAEEGLLSRDDTKPRGPTRREGSFGAFLLRRLPETLELAGQHLALTAVAVVLAIALAVPLGIALTRRRSLAGPVLNAAGVIQTVPSLALLAFMIPVLGLGARSAVAALFLYALLPIVRNTYTGIREVDAELVEAARGMGLEDRQVLRLVELPLAMRTIMAGVRTSTVISIGVATLAAFIGAGGLGDPIVTGLQLNDTRLILSGAIPAALLAVAADLGLERLEKALTPRGAR